MQRMQISSCVPSDFAHSISETCDEHGSTISPCVHACRDSQFVCGLVETNEFKSEVYGSGNEP